MEQMTLVDFLKLPKEQKMEHLAQIEKRKAGTLLNWEKNLKAAAKSGDEKDLGLYSNLKPFLRSLKSQTPQEVTITSLGDILLAAGMHQNQINALEGKTIEVVKEMTDEDLLALKGIGEKAVEAIRNALK